MADVFVSYSRQDAGFVRDLNAFLVSVNRDAWVDWEDIPPASEWEREIYDSIDDADSFVFVASPASLASEYCALELNHAADRGKRIVPLAIDGASPDEAPAVLRQLNWIWCRETDDRDAALAALTSALDTDLEWSRAHTELVRRAVAWNARGDGSLLLRGKDLAEKERVLAANAGKDPRPTELQERYLHASRRSARRRQRALLGGVSVALAVAVGLGIATLLQRNTAIRERDSARSTALANAAKGQRDRRLDVALLLGLEANRVRPTVEARSSMVSALEAIESTQAHAILRTDAPVTAVAFSSDGKMLAVGEENGRIRIWDLQSHREQPGPPLSAGTDEVTSLAFSSRGDMLVTGDKTLHVRLWNLRTRKQLKGDAMTMPADEWSDGVSAVSFSPDDSMVAGVDATQAMLWEVANHQRHGRPLRLAEADYVVDASFSPGGRTLARLLPGSVELWKIRYDDIAASNRMPDNGIDTATAQTAALSGDGRTVAASNYESPENMAGDYAGDSGPVMTKAGLELVGPAVPVQLWTVGRPHEPIAVETGHVGTVQAIAFDPDTDTLASGGNDDTVRLSTVPAARTTAAPRRVSTMAVAFTPNGGVVAGGNTEHGMWASTAGELRPPDVPAGATKLAFSADGKRGIASWDTRAQVWTVATGHVFGRPLHVQPESVAALSRDGTRAVTGSARTGEARLWNVQTGKQLHRLPKKGDGAIHSVAFSRDGTFVVTGADHGKARLWEVASGEDAGVFDPHEDAGAVESVAFSADGKHLMTGNGDGTARIWTVSNRRQVGEPLHETSHGYGVVGVAFAPDGRTVATANAVEQVQLWDVTSHQPLGDPLPGDAVAFSPDGRSLANASFLAQTTQLWKHILWRDMADLRGRVCSIVWRDLTPAEWATHAPGLPTHATCTS